VSIQFLVNSNLCDAQWRMLDQLHGENYACQDYVDREIIWHATVMIVCLRLFIPLGGKKLPRGNLWSVRKKTVLQSFRIEGRKWKVGRRIRNPQNIVSEALQKITKCLMIFVKKKVHYYHIWISPGCMHVTSDLYILSSDWSYKQYKSKQNQTKPLTTTKL
jgi:hypothetical protein